MLFENNCQNFVKYLFETICAEPFPLLTIKNLFERQIRDGSQYMPRLPGAYPSSIMGTSVSDLETFYSAMGSGRDSIITRSTGTTTFYSAMGSEEESIIIRSAGIETFYTALDHSRASAINPPATYFFSSGIYMPSFMFDHS